MILSPPTAIDGGAARVPDRWLHRLAVLVAAATFLLIGAGGMVTSTGSGLSVPDWPTSYGYNMFTFPPSKWVGGILYEHSHRLIASAVGLLTVVLAVWIQLRERRRRLRILGWSALGLIVLQGLLGGLTVLYLLPTPISVFHGCLAQSFFCVVVSIAVFTSPAWVRRPAVPGGGALCAALTAAVFIQLILGAVMRHTDSGLAVPDFPWAYGRLWPSLAGPAMDDYNHMRRWTYWLPPVTASQVAYHLAHRGWAVVVSALGAAASFTILRRGEPSRAIRRAALLFLGLLIAQITLGGWTVLSGKLPWVATAHVAVGAAMLGTAWYLTLATWPSPRPRRAKDVQPAVGLGVAT